MLNAVLTPTQAGQRRARLIAQDASAFRRWIAPLLLITVTPILVVVIWLIVVKYNGSITGFVTTTDARILWAQLPRPTWAATAILAFWVVFQGALLALLPGRKHLGPITPAGARPRYKLNAIPAWVITHVGLLLAWWAGWWSPATVYEQFGSMLIELTVFALGFCVFLYVKGRYRPSSEDAVYTGSFLFDFFQGVELHPRLLGVNLKQLINCRVSMMGWSMLMICFAGYQYQTYGHVSNSMLVSTILVVAYLFTFFLWESGYFSSLDIMHDRFGYYICWGVLAWVPSVYTIFGLYLAHHPIELHPAWAITIAVVGLGAMWANYAADMQRVRVRATGGQTKVWGRPPRTLVARYRSDDGSEHENLLLVSGYWGLARHFHYTPQLLMAWCFALPVGLASPLAYLYPVFLTILLIDRANRDDKRCHAKYGDTWEEYRRLVPYKILPGVF